MNRRRAIFLFVFAVALALVPWIVGSRERAVVAAVEALAREASAGGTSRDAERYLADDVVVVVGEAAPIEGREAVLRALDSVRARTAVVSIESLQVVFASDEARVNARVLRSESQVGDLHKDERTLSVTMIHRGDAWVARSITIGRERHDAPEARP